MGDKYWGDPKRGLPLTHTAKMAAQLWMREKARTATKLQVHHIVEHIYRDSVVTNIKKYSYGIYITKGEAVRDRHGRKKKQGEF